MGHQLHPIADAQNRDPLFQESLGHQRSVSLIDASRPSRENDTARAITENLLKGSGMGKNLREDLGFADTTSDELGVLRPEVEDQNPIMPHVHDGRDPTLSRHPTLPPAGHGTSPLAFRSAVRAPRCAHTSTLPGPHFLGPPSVGLCGHPARRWAPQRDGILSSQEQFKRGIRSGPREGGVLLRIRPVVGRLLGDDHVMNVSFSEAGQRLPNEGRVALQLSDCSAPAIAHAGLHTTD